MSSRTEILKSQIKEAKQRIITLFIEQCDTGKQSEGLKEEGALACGQFLGALDKSQRGIHGTAAALKVLSDSEGSLCISKNITCYLKNRKEIEQKINGIKADKIDRDYSNIIKLSETLIALEQTDASIVDNDLKNDLIQRITNGTAKGKALWGYFAQDESEELLPTAFAMIALSATGYKQMANKAADHILDNLKRKYLNQKVICPSNTDISIDVFCLFALTFRDNAHLPDKKSVLGKMYKIFWGKLSRLLCDEYEQNVEYYYGGERTCYVRVPWDLYLIALASHFSYERNFSSPVVQARLDNLLSRVLNGGFIYPNSGRYISSRTNAILYDVLSFIEIKLIGKNIKSVYTCLQKVWESKITRWLIRVALIIIGIVVFVVWFRDANKSITDFAPEIFSIAITFIFSLTYRK